MKIVHFTIDDNRSGAVRATSRLHQGLLALDIDSKMLVLHKTSDDPSVVQVNTPKVNPLVKIIQDYYIQFQRTSLTNTFFSLGYPGVLCHHEKIVQEADLLVLHWVADFLNPTEIAALLSLGKPIVWVFHDMRAMTAGCHYTGGCRQFINFCKACPQLKTDPFDVIEANFQDQKEVFSNKLITVVAPSQWMAREVRESAIFNKNRVETIPYGLDSTIFAPGNKKEARKELAIDSQSFVVLLACSNPEEKRKGFSYLKEVIDVFSEYIEIDFQGQTPEILLLFIGQKTINPIHNNITIKDLGFLESDEKLRQAYVASDVLLHLSVEDNLPNMVMEAMASGTPVVGFDAGGIGDMVLHGKNGFLAPVGNTRLLGQALASMLLNPIRNSAMSQTARELVERHFKLEEQAKRHLALYEKLLNQPIMQGTGLQLKPRLKIEQIIPKLLAIAESITHFIQIERESCTKQLQSLANTITNKKLKPLDCHWSIDIPKSFNINKKCKVIGWIFDKHEIPIKELRLNIREKYFNLSMRLPRLDVNSHFNNSKGADFSGFEGIIKLNRGLNKVTIEAFTNVQKWESIGTIKVVYIPILGDIYHFLMRSTKKLISKRRLLFPIKAKVENIIRAFIQGGFSTVIHSYLDQKKLIGLGYLVQHEPKQVANEHYPLVKKAKTLAKNRITIVTPSYNQASFLEKTIQSVLDQKHPFLEYIVIDGGSKDHSSSIIEKYKSLLAYSVSETDEGQSDAIQKGFSKCTGKSDDIMAYLNSDDLYLPGCLDFVASYFEKNPNVDLIYGHRVLIDDNGQEIGRWFTPRHNNYNLSVLDYVPQETMFWRKRVYDKIGGIDPSFHFAMDWDFLLRAQASGAVIKRIPYFLGCFRVHAQQKTSTQMNTIGEIEINKLRERSHQGKITDRHIANIHRKNSIESAITHALFSKGIRF